MKTQCQRPQKPKNEWKAALTKGKMELILTCWQWAHPTLKSAVRSMLARSRQSPKPKSQGTADQVKLAVQRRSAGPDSLVDATQTSGREESVLGESSTPSSAAVWQYEISSLNCSLLKPQGILHNLYIQGYLIFSVHYHIPQSSV